MPAFCPRLIMCITAYQSLLSFAVTWTYSLHEIRQNLHWGIFRVTAHTWSCLTNSKQTAILLTCRQSCSVDRLSSCGSLAICLAGICRVINFSLRKTLLWGNSNQLIGIPTSLSGMIWCLSGVSGVGVLFWHRCVQQALTPDFQLWGQISESGRKGPDGPVCNCCSGVRVDDGEFYWGQSTYIAGWPTVAKLVQLKRFWFFPPLLVALMFDFLSVLCAAIYLTGLSKVHGLSDCWIMILLSVQCCIIKQTYYTLYFEGFLTFSLIGDILRGRKPNLICSCLTDI